MVQNGKVGRPSAISKESFLVAVEGARSMNTDDIARKLNVGKTTVWRYINNPKNADIVDEANKKIIAISSQAFTSDLDNWDIFMMQTDIIEWNNMLELRQVSKRKAKTYIRSLWYICKHLKVHPNNIRIDDVVDTFRDIKMKYLRDEKNPYGLAYLTLREGLRSFFMLVRGISGDLLSTKYGITKEEAKGQGKYSKQRVTPNQRKRFEETIKDDVTGYDQYLEVLGVCKFMYYTGTRISASLEFSFKTNKYTLQKDIWMIEVIDKGEKGGIKWEKYLIGHALIEMKEYCSKRFKIEIEDLEDKLPKTTDYLFPSFINGGGRTKDEVLRNIVRSGLKKAGLTYQRFPPLHIWRHTFAQDMLDSTTPPNYEMTAMIGGWKTTHILRKHYGAMSEESLLNGLRIAMGLEVKIIKKELKW